MLANRKVENGSRLSVTILLTNASGGTDTPKLDTKGIVVRTESHPDGTCGVAIRFTKYKFM